MKFVNPQFQKIWDLAQPLQDKRDDNGHAQVVTEFAEKLAAAAPEADKNIIVPAAILHDIGWSNLPKEECFMIFDKSKTKEEMKIVRIKHQEEGVKLAKEILEKVNYPKEITEKILEIISQHDTREGFISNEEGLMRDADKLWRYSIPGTEADIVRRKINAKEYLDYVAGRIEEQNFFYTQEGKNLAYSELNKRKREYNLI